jgi:photosystem II stability/assembly factor-like uncharacterized protein
MIRRLLLPIALMLAAALSAALAGPPFASSSPQRGGAPKGDWVRLPTPTDLAQVHLYGVSFIDRWRGWVVGVGGSIWATTDAGHTWSRQASGTDATLTDVWFVDSQHGWASGGFTADDPYYGGSVLVRTEDGGLTWHAQQLPDLDSWTDCILRVQFLDPRRGFALATNSVTGFEVFATDDGGLTWQKRTTSVPVPTLGPDSISDVWFAEEQHGWAVGSRRTRDADGTTGDRLPAILGTSDGGLTWVDESPMAVNRVHLNAVSFSDSLHGWAVGFVELEDRTESEAVYLTTDGGSSWTRHAPLTGGTGPGAWMDIALTRDGFGWVMGNVLAWATDDHGASWSGTTLPQDRTQDICIVDPGCTYVVGRQMIRAFDSSRPRAYALASAKVRSGGTVKLRWRVDDDWPCGGRAVAYIKIRNRRGRVVAERPGRWLPVGMPNYTGYVCKLPRGIYRYTVYAEDMAGNRQSATGSARLTVL